MAGDYSVDAGGLDVTAAVAFNVVASVVVSVVAVVTSAAGSVVVAVALFWGGGSFFYGLPRSTLLYRDGPQAPDLACLVRLSKLTFKSNMTKDRVFRSTASTRSGIGKILSFSKYWAYLPTLSFA